MSKSRNNMNLYKISFSILFISKILFYDFGSIDFEDY